MNRSDLTITVSRLRTIARIGVLPLEKTVPQEFEVTMSVTIPYDGSDRLESTINYAALCDIAAGIMLDGGDLIEHACARIAGEIARSYPQVKEGRVTVAKLAPPMPHSVERVEVTLPVIAADASA